MAILIRPDLPSQMTKPEDTAFTLDELQHHVGGDIEIVDLSAGILLVINESGKLESLPRNDIATYLAESVLFAGDYIAGPAVLTTNAEMGDE